MSWFSRLTSSWFLFPFPTFKNCVIKNLKTWAYCFNLLHYYSFLCSNCHICSSDTCPVWLLNAFDTRILAFCNGVYSMLILYIFCLIPGISHFFKHFCPVIWKAYSEVTVWVHCFYFAKLNSKLKSRASWSNDNFESHARV